MRRSAASSSSSNQSHPCITMHQPWASLLVHGIKRIEGRSWPAPLRGQLWIHAASKVPDVATVKAMEDYYRNIYAVNGITDLEFPEEYPVSQLLGCVEVVGCVKCDELVNWEEVPESVRLEGLTKFCWLCEKPQRLLVPFVMRGYQGVYDLEWKIYEGAVRGLCEVKSPQPVKFPLPNPQNPFSLKPGSLTPSIGIQETSMLEKPPSLISAIAGARAAATQFSKKEARSQESSVQGVHTFESSPRWHIQNKFTKNDRKTTMTLHNPSKKVDSRSNNKEQNPFDGRIFYHAQRQDESKRLEAPSDMFTKESRSSEMAIQRNPGKRDSIHSEKEPSNHVKCEENKGICNQCPEQDPRQRFAPSSKIFEAAVRGLKLT